MYLYLSKVVNLNNVYWITDCTQQSKLEQLSGQATSLFAMTRWGNEPEPQRLLKTIHCSSVSFTSVIGLKVGFTNDLVAKICTELSRHKVTFIG